MCMETFFNSPYSMKLFRDLKRVGEETRALLCEFVQMTWLGVYIRMFFIFIDEFFLLTKFALNPTLL